VRLHVLQGIDEARVPEIAEGLNRSKQVDDPSLDNLRGVFDNITDVMRGKPGEKAIAYHHGADGEVYITDVVVYLQLFNGQVPALLDKRGSDTLDGERSHAKWGIAR